MNVLFRFWVWLMLRCGFYYSWSKVYQRVVDGAFRKCLLPLYDSVEELEAFLGSMQWIKDGLLSLGDAIGLPQATYWRHKLGYRHRGFIGCDCDEFALYAADRMANMYRRGVLNDMGVADIYLLTVTWIKNGKSGGHNVCLFSYVDQAGKWRWAHLSNWNGGRMIGGFLSVVDAVGGVLNAAGADACLGWATATPTLKRAQYGSGKRVDHMRRSKA